MGMQKKFEIIIYTQTAFGGRHIASHLLVVRGSFFQLKMTDITYISV